MTSEPESHEFYRLKFKPKPGSFAERILKLASDDKKLLDKVLPNVYPESKTSGSSGTNNTIFASLKPIHSAWEDRRCFQHQQ